MFCTKNLLKNFAILIRKYLCWSLFLTLLKETPAQVFSCEYCKIFKNSIFYRAPLLAPAKLFILNSKRNSLFVKSLVMKTFKFPLPIDIAFITPIRCSEHLTQLETMFFSEDFLVVVIHQYFSFVYIQIKTYIAFTCVNPLLFLLPFIFIVLLPFIMSFKSNFGLNFYTISLFIT